MRVVISIIIMLAVVDYSYALICGDEIVLKVTKAGTCDDTPADYPYQLSSNCTATQKDNNCILTSFTVCCDDTALSYKDAVSITQTIKNVPIGQERDAVLDAFDYWKSVTPFKTPVDGFVQTDSLEGFAYISNAGISGNSADVTWVGWKRSGYVKQGAGGQHVPLEDIINSGSGSGSSSVDIDYVRMKDAFLDALRSNDLTGVKSAVDAAIANKIGAATIKEAMKEAIAGSGGLSGGSSGGGSGISLSDLENLLGGEYFGYDGVFDYPYDSGAGQIGDIPDLFDSFVNNIKQTGLFSLPDKFFGSVPVSGISSITINAGRYGVHEYDFASGAWPTVLGIIKGIVMVIFSFASVRTIIMKR